MQYYKQVQLKNGIECKIRNATYEDGPELSELFVLAHGETDYLLSYPEEHSFDAKGESDFLQNNMSPLE